jgi:hypothetical protein
MNANELADELENTMRHRNETVFTQAANMLRQQQAEIEILKAKYQQEFDYVEKKFSDEEINWFAKAYTDRKGKLNTNDFARAILRKTQDK